MNEIDEKSMYRLMDISILLSSERNFTKLLDIIITEAMKITNCDGGTLYLRENNMLNFEIVRTHSMGLFQGGSDLPITLPPVPITEKNVCSYVVIHRNMINIEDVYFSDEFDFSGPKNYDSITGYRTKSMLVIPLENNKGEVVGVLQLINALDENKDVISFDKRFEQIFRSIASQAAIAVANMRYTKEVKDLFNSLVEVLAAAIDERSPYNANHTKNVATLVTSFVDFINESHINGETPIFFEEELREQIIMSSWLHDIGKITTPLEIMDKATRLGSSGEKMVRLRFDTIYLSEEVRFLHGELSQSQWDILSSEIQSAKALCIKVDTKGSSDPEEIEKIKSYRERVTTLANNEKIHWLTEEEIENLEIQHGTLSPHEREIMQNHVVITTKLLSKIKFPNEYKDVPTFASGHHEKLNGKGYPNGLTAKDLPMATRLISIIDVFEALIAKDRPYKKPMDIDCAFDVLDKMVATGELDYELVRLLKKQHSVTKGKAVDTKK